MCLDAEQLLDSLEVSAICIDSRTCTEGSVFFALRGEHTEGYRFLPDAFENGARIAVVPKACDCIVPVGMRVIPVDDPLRALHHVARRHLERGSTRTIGITGSNGKTTVKDLLAAVLREKFRVYATEGNLNSETGVPLAVFSIDREAEWGVFEMASNHPGEMHDLAQIVRPDIAVITNIGSAHIGNFRDRSAIAAEKKAITDWFSGNQVLIVPEEDDFSDFLQTGIRGETQRFGLREQRAGYKELGRMSELSLPGFDVQVPLPGLHNVNNALAVIRVAGLLGIDSDAIARGFRSFRVRSGRSEIIRGERIVLNESYNANPESVTAGLEAFDRLCDVEQVGERIVILGEMKELGAHSAEAHRTIVERARKSATVLLCLVGAAMESYSDGASARVVWHPDAVSLEAFLGPYLKAGQAVYVKGSRSVGLERLLPALTGSKVESLHA